MGTVILGRACRLAVLASVFCSLPAVAQQYPQVENANATRIVTGGSAIYHTGDYAVTGLEIGAATQITWNDFDFVPTGEGVAGWYGIYPWSEPVKVYMSIYGDDTAVEASVTNFTAPPGGWTFLSARADTLQIFVNLAGGYGATDTTGTGTAPTNVTILAEPHGEGYQMRTR